MHTNPEWHNFERIVTRHFSLKGFMPVTDIREAGRQNDLILESRDECVGRILVECKYRSRGKMMGVGVNETEAFASKCLRLRSSGDINSGYLITNADFTRDAKGMFSNRPERNFLFLRTFKQLLRQLINFDFYYRRFIADTLSGRLLERYEPLSMRSQNQVSRSCESVVKSFLRCDDAQVLALSGDSGAGKTTTCHYLFYQLAKSALEESYIGRLPCLIPLKRYNVTGTAQSFILDYLASSVGIRNVSFDCFDAMNQAGLLLLILDGFDEMAKRVTQQIRDECFAAISELAGPQTKIIITGRPAFFPTDSEMLRTIGTVIRTQSQRLGVGRAIKARLIAASIEPLSESQMLSFLLKQFRPRDGKRAEKSVTTLYSKLKRMYNLRELATRPILLEMIAANAAQIVRGQVSNVADLYEVYTDQWLKVDFDKGTFRGLITPKARLEFSLKLAWHMLSTASDTIHYTSMPEFAADHFKLHEDDDIDYFSNDVQNCCFLKRTPDGFYSFVHNSFKEYFVARYIVAINRPEHVFNESEAVGSIQDLQDIYEVLPNVFHFLDSILEIPLSPRFWREIYDNQEYAAPFFDAESDVHFALVQKLAEGDLPIHEVGEFLQELRPLKVVCKRLAVTFRASQNIMLWQQRLCEAFP